MMGSLRNKNVLSIFFKIFLETQNMICLALADKGLDLEDGGKARRGTWALG